MCGISSAARTEQNQIQKTQKLSSKNTQKPSTGTSIEYSRSGYSTSLKSDQRHQKSAYSNCSVLTPTKVRDPSLLESCNPVIATQMTLLTHRRRRLLQRHACLLSILAAFVVGLGLGVLAPILGMSRLFTVSAFPTLKNNEPISMMTHLPILSVPPLQHSGFKNRRELESIQNRTHSNINIHTNTNRNKNKNKNTNSKLNKNAEQVTRPPSDFPTIYGLETIDKTPPASNMQLESSPYSVSFAKEQSLELPAEEILHNAFQLSQVNSDPNAMIIKKLDMTDGSIKQFRVDRIGMDRFRKGPEKRRPKIDKSIIPLAERIVANTQSDKQNHDIIKSDIYWGDLIEGALPQGFSEEDAKAWNSYVTTEGIISRFEPGCGRMQNRLVIFADGTRACARYRQNTDQIQGEIFSFYLGQLLNITNLAPSAATVVNLDSKAWSAALRDVTQAQWKQQRPVVLTRWLPDLEPAGIPQPFQPLERHLNKFDVWNITLSGTNIEKQGSLLQRLRNATQHNQSPSASSSGSASASASASASTSASASSSASSSSSSSLPIVPSPVVLQRLVELAQWSDLIVFDYLIANLDRVVNNLYNFQWNADIMAAPAHNLARQTNTQLLVFLDNESGLLHGYRLLKKYEAYHGLLLDNLCIFRQPTIDALRQLRTDGAGRKLRQIFERTTSNAVRDVLPSLPDKSIKILVDRIDRVLGQVQKCKDLLSNR